MAIKLNEEGLIKLGETVKKHLDNFANDRLMLEQQWLRNLRQYRGKYDPEVLKMIPEERSRAYPRDTRLKVKGGVAKMMEMMFPAQENNWELTISPVPSVPHEALEGIISTLEQEELMRAEEEQRTPQPVESDAIEREVRKFAEDRKDAMQKEIADQLSDPQTDYPQLAKRVVRSGYIYGFGVCQSPNVRKQEERVWQYNPTLGTYEAKTKTLKRPYPEFAPVWDCYPDLSAKTWEEQERFFRRFVLHRHDLAQLAKRPDFIKERIRQYLKDHQEGNYKPKAFETDLHELSNTANLSERQKRRYEVYRHLGFISAHELSAAGVEVKEEDLDKDILADIWLVDDVVIKAEVAVYGVRPCGAGGQFHAFVYTEDEDAGLTGIGLPEEVRDSQMALCASTRAVFDNMAAVAGPIYEVNEDLLPPGVKGIGAIHAFMTIRRQGDGNEANYPAVRPLVTDSHIAEIQGVVKAAREQLDMESNLPAWTFGAIDKLGEGVRTSFNMSQMTGGANMVTKDTVRAFDRFTSSLLGSFLGWNMEFNPNEDLKGDYQVRAKGNLSLVAREVRGAALDQFMQNLTDQERAILDTRGLLIDRLKAKDLPTDRVLPEKEARQVLDNMAQAASQAQQIEQGLTQAKTAQASARAEKDTTDAALARASADAVIQELLSRVELQLASADATEDRTQLENLKTLLEAAGNGAEQRSGANGAAQKQPSAGV